MRGLAVAAVILALLAFAPPALGHASLVETDPVDRAVLAGPPAELKLVFNEPVSPIRLLLVAPDGRTIDLDDVAAADRGLTVRVPIELGRGTHLLSWRVVSADGHPVGGAFMFSVIEPSAEAPLQPRSGADRRLNVAIWFGRVALYVGLLFGIGGAFYAAWIAEAVPSQCVRRLIGAALLCGVVAAVVSVGLQGADLLDLPLSQIVRPGLWGEGAATSFGATAGLAVAACLLAGWSLRLGARGRWLALAALVGAGAALAASGHAAAAAPGALMRPAVFVHGATVMFWAGSLAPLAAAMRSGNERAAGELLRFSRAIAIVVAALSASGAVLAVVQLGSVAALWTTRYGLILSAKLAAVAALLALGAFNRIVLTPAIAAGDGVARRRLATSIAVEIALMAVVVALVAAWRFTPPPRTALARAAAPVQVHIHTAKAMADVRFEPPRAGQRAVLIGVWDGQFGPLPAKEVALVLSKPGSGIEPLHMPAGHVADATWRVDGLSLPMSGRWRVRVEILIDDFDRIAIDDEVDFDRR